MCALLCQSRVDYLVCRGWLGNIVDCSKAGRRYRCWDVAIPGQNDCPRVRVLLLKCFDNIKTAAILKSMGEAQFEAATFSTVAKQCKMLSIVRLGK